MDLGDIHWIELPTSNGHEQAGRRPAILLQDSSNAGQLPVVFAAPLTTSLATRRFPGTVLVSATPESGLRQESVCLVFQLRAIDRKRVRERIGNVSESVLLEIYVALDNLLGRK